MGGGRETALVFSEVDQLSSADHQIGVHHGRRISLEEKAKFVASAWGTELIQFLGALAIFH